MNFLLLIPFGAFILLLIVAHVQEMQHLRDTLALHKLYTDLMFEALDKPEIEE